MPGHITGSTESGSRPTAGYWSCAHAARGPQPFLGYGAPVPRLSILLLGCALALGCDDTTSPDLTTGPEPTAAPESAPIETQANASDGWGNPRVDRLYALRAGRMAAVFCVDEPTLVRVARELAGRIDAIRDRDLQSLSADARIVLQNDVWGVAQRASRPERSEPALHALAIAAVRLVERAALPATAFDGTNGLGFPAAAARRLPEAEGWLLSDSEMPVLSHESAFGLRRLFRVALRPGHRALVSQLVAIDQRGRAHPTPIVGEIELLRVGEEAILEARVWHLDRGALKGPGTFDGLEAARRVHHVPGLGANSFFLDLEPPEELASLPCVRCHDTTFAMSLPVLGDGTERIQALLPQIEARWRELVETSTPPTQSE